MIFNEVSYRGCNVGKLLFTCMGACPPPPHKYKYLHADGKTACCNDGSVKSAVVAAAAAAAAAPITRY